MDVLFDTPQRKDVVFSLMVIAVIVAVTILIIGSLGALPLLIPIATEKKQNDAEKISERVFARRRHRSK